MLNHELSVGTNEFLFKVELMQKLMSVKSTLIT
jgi:hypothetical protein